MRTISNRFDYTRRRLALTFTSADDRNVLLLYAEVIFVGVLSSAAAFNSAYVLRLGGSTTVVGLLSSLPALVAMLLFMPAARMLEKKSNYFPWVVGSLLVSRLGYLLVLALPLFLRSLLPEVSVAVLVAMTVPSVVFSTGWSPMLSDIVPPESRATVLAWRSMLSSGTVAVLTFVIGRLLDRGTFPSNYQWMYAAGLIGGLISVAIVSRIQIPHPEAQQTAPVAAQAKGGATIKSVLTNNPGFVRIIVNTFVYALGPWMVGPLYMILFVRELGASDSWVGLNTTLVHIGVVAGYWLWRRIIAKIGENHTLLVALPLTALYSLLIALFPNLTVILFVGFMHNLLLPGMRLSHSVIWFGILPQGRKHIATALYSALMNVGAFAGPLVGVAIANRIGIVPTILVSTSLRIVGIVLFYMWPVQGERIRLSDVMASASRLVPQRPVFRRRHRA